MAHELAEVDVEVVSQGESAVLVNDGDSEGWVPYSLIDSESDITKDSQVGHSGTLILPQWKAEGLGLV